MSSKPYIMHILSHTHWDREWYQDFQGFRQRLVFQTDKMMDLLEQKPEFKCFHMDGQTIWLKDYLQIRPESHGRITRHLQSGRVLMGPWYVMPDELILSGESLVRNLVLGHRMCDEFGIEPMPMGYVTDIFGHCSQFPQIVRGFGMDCILLHRGTTNADGASEMLWEGADGSEVLIIKAYPYSGYNDFLTYRDSDEKTLLEYEEKKKEYAATNVLFALDGNDHMPADWLIFGRIDRWNNTFKEIECKHSSMLDYLKDLKAALGDYKSKELVKYTGELRHTAKTGLYSEVFCGCSSARVNLKQQNDDVEYLLARKAEFMHACSVKMGGDSQKPFLDLAWEYLIANHPHDSIVGCSIDQVHKDMIYRFDQARLIAKNSIGESVFAIGDRLDTESLGESHAVATVYNPSSADSGPVLEFPFEILSQTLGEKEKEGLAPALFDGQGKQVYFEIAQNERNMWPTPQVKKEHGECPSFFRIPNAYVGHNRFHIRAIGSIPALGYNSWAVRFVPKETAENVSLPGDVQPVLADAAARTIENEYLKLKVREDALIDILDKSAGIWYEGLHELEDCGDAGSGWDHKFPANDKVIKSSEPRAKSDVRVCVEQMGQLSAKAVVSFNMRIPADIKPGRKERTEEDVQMPISLTFTLKPGSRRVDCEAVVQNNAKCHRVRALFPTNRKTDVWYGDTAFDMVKRSIKLPDTTDWQEHAYEQAPIKNIAAVQDKDGGFAVLTKGLCEACVQDNSERTLALTLFRCFKQQIGDGWTQDSQMLGELRLNYAIVPFAPAEDAPVQLFDEVERYKLPLISLTSPASTGDLPVSGQFMNIPDGLVVSTIKTAEDNKGIVARLFNPSSHGIEGELSSGLSFEKAWKCDMLERCGEELSVVNGNAVLSVKPKEVVTIRFE